MTLIGDNSGPKDLQGYPVSPRMPAANTTNTRFTFNHLRQGLRLRGGFRFSEPENPPIKVLGLDISLVHRRPGADGLRVRKNAVWESRKSKTEKC